MFRLSMMNLNLTLLCAMVRIIFVDPIEKEHVPTNIYESMLQLIEEDTFPPKLKKRNATWFKDKK